MKNISLKNVDSGYVIRVAQNITFEELYKYFVENIGEYSEFLNAVDIVGVDGLILNEEDKKSFKNLFKEKINSDIKSLEPFSLSKYYEQAEKRAKKSKYEKELYKEFDRFLSKNEEKVEDVEQVSSEIAKDILQSLEENRNLGHQSDLSETYIKDKPVIEIMPTVFHRGTVRSGTCINSQGHIVVIGDVNAGAELFAKGNIIVMGMLKAVAHAGCEGDDSAFITAFKFLSEQVRISSYVGLTAELDDDKNDMPKIVTIQDNKIVIKKYI